MISITIEITIEIVTYQEAKKVGEELLRMV